MISSTITVRIDEAKKNRGNAILKQRGLTPSQCINELYDLMIEKGDILWENREQTVFSATKEKIDEARAFITSIPKKSRFSTMSDEEIKLERLKNRGLVE